MIAATAAADNGADGRKGAHPRSFLSFRLCMPAAMLKVLTENG